MNLEYFREFLVFSRYLSVSEAARILHVSQPTLSTHISQLEKDLGVSLVNRGKGFRLSADGYREAFR